MDTDRIGGGISEYLEQLADKVYNWHLQLLYVYDTGFQFVLGARPPKVVISVKEGSLLPKDSTSIANQAIDLGKNGKMALVDMYKRLEYPNPEELAANVWLEINAPHLLYKNNPIVQEAIALQQQAAADQAAAQAVAESEKGTAEHGRAMETEVVRGALKNANERIKQGAKLQRNHGRPFCSKCQQTRWPRRHNHAVQVEKSTRVYVRAPPGNSPGV